MVTPYKHKRSATAGATPQTLLDGELALRYATADPALFFKDSSNNITHILAKIDGGVVLATPTAPSLLQPEVSDGQVTLAWTAPQNTYGNEITAYVVEYSTDAGATWQPVV